MTSTYWLKTCEKSAALSRLPKPTSCPRKRLDPPKCAIPVSKLTRVRSDCFSKIIAITRPGKSGSRHPPAGFGFKSSAVGKKRSTSEVESSKRVRICFIEWFQEMEQALSACLQCLLTE